MQDGGSQPSSSAESSSSGGQVDSPSAYKAPQFPVVMRPLSERVPVFKSPHAGAPGTSSPYPRKVNRWSPSTHSPARVAITYFHNGITNHARKIFRAMLKANLRMTDTNCPMCCAVQRDEMHKPAKCPMKDVNLGAQIKYREDNDWTAPFSCWPCGLPDAYCNCEKKGGTEPSQRTRDAVRGILLLLTHNEDVRDEAVSYAQGMYNPEYTLGPPRGPGLLAPEWQETIVFMNDIKVYRAFPAVAAVLIMMNDIAVNGTTVEWEE
ncbi:hypothetical protein A4X03_0g9723 [Tilletia caries]|uniref:Uncharacterized protein n=1 Tax=Tilletia caries TaxID=13290 RepID=A0A8T8S9M0_9BASI|nr:hypothetical protein A4X03_0g9723 [Tilletia caries]